MNTASVLEKKIIEKSAKVGVIGMGYVGAALADIVIVQGYRTTGFVTRQERVEKIIRQNKENLTATTDIEKLKEQDIVLVCVQTPVDENKLPDLTSLKRASQQVADHLSNGQLVIIESSIATGTTRNVVLPILEKTGLKAGKDYFLSFSPERVDPGNKHFTLDQIPKVVSGLEENSLKLSTLFYQQIMNQVVPVSSLETAELVKLFENTFRLINISLVNELSVYAKTLDINMWEVVNAAATKPFGFMPHYPSPGIGGHCIPVDPFYLYDDAKKRGVNLSLIQASGIINDAQPVRVVSRTFEILQHKDDIIHKSHTGHAHADEGKRESVMHPLDEQNQHMLSLTGVKGGASAKKKQNHKVLLLGLAYKPDIDDLRESPSLRIWKLFEDAGCTVSYHDSHIPTHHGKTSLDLTEDVIAEHDILVITTNHSNVNYEELAKFNKPILDTRNVYANNSHSHVFSL